MLCFELGRTPRELAEQLDSAEFYELLAFQKMKRDEERKAYEQAKRESSSRRR